MRSIMSYNQVCHYFTNINYMKMSHVGMQYGNVGSSANWGLPLSEVTLAQALKENGGYTTYAIGKWNLGEMQ